MTSRYLVALWLAILALPCHARAASPQWVTANYVGEICKEQTADCSNYLLGLKEGLALGKSDTACVLSLDTSQLRSAFLLYASRHPEELAGPAAKMGAEAFNAACR